MMRNFFSGILLSSLLLISFTILRFNGIELWSAYWLALFICTTMFIYYVRKKKANLKDIISISIGSGLFYFIFASIGITLFPMKQIRDIGDLIMPYFNSLYFGLLTVIIMSVCGVFFNNLTR